VVLSNRFVRDSSAYIGGYLSGEIVIDIVEDFYVGLVDEGIVAVG
jgi:hypothetical protein